MPKHSHRDGNYGNSVHVNIYMYIFIDSNTHYDHFEGVYVPEEVKNSDTSINAVSLEQYHED